MEFWEFFKWVLLAFMAIPVLLLPLGIYAGFKVSAMLFDISTLIKLLKRPGVLRLVITLMVIVVGLGGWGIKGHSEKDMYAEYISQQVSNDFRQLSYYILRNNSIYEEIISTEKILVSHLSFLKISNGSISITYDNYDKMARDFNRIKHNEFSFMVRSEASRISQYFHNLEEAIAREHGIVNIDRAGPLRAFELSEEDIEKIQLIYTLNDSWANVIVKNVVGTSKSIFGGRDFINRYYDDKYKSRAVYDSYWSDVILGLREETQEFFDRYHISREAWLSR